MNPGRTPSHATELAVNLAGFPYDPRRGALAFVSMVLRRRRGVALLFRENQPRPAVLCGRATLGTNCHRRILRETALGDAFEQMESPALRDFHGSGRTRTCVLRIMSYVSGVEHSSAKGMFRAWRCPQLF